MAHPAQRCAPCQAGVRGLIQQAILGEWRAPRRRNPDARKHPVGGQHGADALPVPFIRALKAPCLSCCSGATKAERHQPLGLCICGLCLEKRFFQRPEPVEGLVWVRTLLPPCLFLGTGKGRQKIRKRTRSRMFQVHAQRIHTPSEGQCGVSGTVAHRPSGSGCQLGGRLLLQETAGAPVGPLMQARSAPAAFSIRGVQGCAQVVMLAADIGQQD